MMMSNWTDSPVDETIDRFARGELSPAEARSLAEAALESSTLFEELTAIAMAKGASASVRAYPEPPPRQWWRSQWIFAAASASATLMIVSVLVAKFVVSGRHSVPTAEPQQLAITHANPTLDFSPDSSRPILLAQDLQKAASARPPQVFRGEKPNARGPRQTGSVILVEDGFATLDLGSIDGLAKGSEVEVFADQTFQKSLGHLRISTIFREQSRAPISNSEIDLHCAVKISAPVHLRALLQQVDDLEGRGRIAEARKVAQQANTWAANANLTAGDRWTALKQLAPLDFRAGDLEAATAHYASALEQVNADQHAPLREKIAIENDLAALAIVGGDYSSATKLLDQPLAGPSNDESDAGRLNNLGVLAELRGDRPRAEALYSQALQSLIRSRKPGQEEKIVEANLARVKGLH